MIKKYKNSLIIFVAFILSIVVSFGIGQIIPKVVSHTQSNEEVDLTHLEDKYVFWDNYEEIVVFGNSSTNENPWGSTIAKIEDEKVGKAIFMTPETGMETQIKVPENGVLYFEYNLYSEVGVKSDGAKLCLEITDLDGTEVINREYNIALNEDFLSDSIDLKEYINQNIKIKFTCSNDKSNNSDCDWVILKNAKLLGGFRETEIIEEEYVKSAHYFSDEWPINFWNSEMDNLEADLKQIKKDGFDSIILVIPWREFQPEVNPIIYNEYTFAKLDEIMKKAEQEGLEVFTRIGYTWDFYEDENTPVTNRFYQLMGNINVQNAWFDYVKTMYDTLSKYKNFKGGFLTWEDFWNNLGVCDSAGGKPEETEISQYIGYQDFIKGNYSLEEYNIKYGEDFESYDDIYIPSREQPAMKAFYDFYDNFLNTILLQSQELFPNLSMEVRIDWDVTYDINGNEEYSKHESTFLSQNSDFTSTMYGIPMGFSNNGERVSYKEAMEKTEYILGNLYDAVNGKKIYVEQFIFADNTPKFVNNAQIKANEINDYLENVSEILLDKTWGYGIWTYRDYRANMLYNSQFAVGLEGWDTKGKVKVSDNQGSNKAYLEKNSSISQTVPEIRNHFPADEYTFLIDTVSDKEVNLIIKVGNQEEKVKVIGQENVEIKFQSDDNYNVEIYADGEIQLDNIRLYSQVQSGLLYDENGRELECISGIRKLNEKLTATVSYQSVIENEEEKDVTVNTVQNTESDFVKKENSSIFLLEESNVYPSNINFEIIEDNSKILLTVEEEGWDSIDVLNPSVVKYSDKYYNYYSGYDGSIWRTGVAVSDDGISWTKAKNNPALDLSKKGWDSDYIAANGSAIVHNNKIYYYYHGVDRNTGKASIGLAISDDGLEFKKYDGPVITAGNKGMWNSISVADPYVIEHDGNLYMYYLGENEQGIQRLGVAMSEDGINWIENTLNPIMDVGVFGAFDEYGLGEPSIIYKAPYFYMLYTGRNSAEQRNIGIAVSTDGVNWKKMNYDGLFQLGGDKWNSQVRCDTTLLDEGDSITVWYGGGNIASPDENLNGSIGMFKIKFDNQIEATEFDAAQSNFETSGIKGAYPIESVGNQQYMWASDKVKIVLKNELKAESIEIEGNVDIDLLKYAGTEEFELSFYINNKMIDKEKINDSGKFNVSVMKNLELGDTFELKIVSNKSIVPSEYNLSNDERRMSYQIYSINQN